MTLWLFTKLYSLIALLQGWPTSRSRLPWSIGECQLVDRAWFCTDLTRYLKRTLFNQCSTK